MDQMVGFQMTDAPGWDADYVKPGTQSTTAKPHAIQVDQSGLRYMNEGGSYEAFCETMLVRNRTVPAVPSWAILDQQYMDEYAVAGKGTAKKNMAKWLASGWMRKADTVGELAGIIGVPGCSGNHGRTLERLRARRPRRGFPARRAGLRQLPRRSVLQGRPEPDDGDDRQGAVLCLPGLSG
ncbi:hypothetical protein ACFSLT_16535 [Novosphingobium resinovorum]